MAWHGKGLAPHELHFMLKCFKIIIIIIIIITYVYGIEVFLN